MDYKIILMRDAEENLDRFITYLLFEKKKLSLSLTAQVFFFIWNILQLWHKFYFH